MSDTYGAPEEPTASRHEAWEVALDRVELDLIRTEQAIEAGTGLARLDQWHVPDYYGPIPVSLRPRAEEILARQQRAVRRISEQLGATLQTQALVDDVARLSTRGSDQAVYVDVNA